MSALEVFKKRHPGEEFRHVVQDFWADILHVQLFRYKKLSGNLISYTDQTTKFILQQKLVELWLLIKHSFVLRMLFICL